MVNCLVYCSGIRVPAEYFINTLYAVYSKESAYARIRLLWNCVLQNKSVVFGFRVRFDIGIVNIVARLCLARHETRVLVLLSESHRDGDIITLPVC